MNLEQLRTEWSAQNEQLAGRVRLHADWLRKTQSGRCNAALGRLTRSVWVALSINLFIALLLGSFIAAHLREPRFLAPALVLQLFALGVIVSSIRQLAAISQLDFDASILSSQRKLETLRIHRIRETKWILLLAPLLWVPLLIVALNAFLGLDAYVLFPGAWLEANLLLGIAVIPLMHWASRRFATRFSSSSMMQNLMNDVAGRNLTEAQQYLAGLADFENPRREP